MYIPPGLLVGRVVFFSFARVRDGNVWVLHTWPIQPIGPLVPIVTAERREVRVGAVHCYVHLLGNGQQRE